MKNITYYILRKEDEKTVATTSEKEFAEAICKNIGFECIIRVAEYSTGI